MQLAGMAAPLLCLALPAFAADAAKVDYDLVARALIQQRLERVTRKLADRRTTLQAMFQEAGCTGDRLTTQVVPHSKEPNVICTLPGEAAATIVVGGHYDLAERGMGAVDDWSGASLLPSLYQSLAGKPRKHRIVFVGFAAEERGLYGSREYVKKLSAEERAATRAMVNLECLGLNPPKVEHTRADKQLLDAYFRVVLSLDLQPAAVNFDERYFADDSHSFRDAKIPVISIHSITQDTLRVLHSPNDNVKAINPDYYYAAYRLAATYLAFIDGLLQ